MSKPWLMIGSLTLTFLSAACSDGTGPGTPEGLQLTFAEGGTHTAQGEPSFAGGQLGAGTFALAFADSVGGLVITSFQVTDGSVGDLFVLQINEVAVGTWGPCRVGGDCHGRILEGLDREDLQSPPVHWEMIDGEVVVEALVEGRITGRLSDLTFEGAEGTTRAVESGTFDLPLLSHAEGIAIMQCFLASVTGGSCATQ